MTKIFPLRRTILQFSQIRLTLERTFMKRPISLFRFESQDYKRLDSDLTSSLTRNSRDFDAASTTGPFPRSKPQRAKT